jgi:hypothetical protein
MKTPLGLFALLFTFCAVAYAQVVPEATGPARLPISGNLNYSLRYSQTAEFGDLYGNWQTGGLSGSANYANGKEALPFSLTFGGGYTAAISGVPYATGPFENLLLSQGIVGRKWNVMLSDNESYRREAPTTGFSGVPGTGEPIGAPNPSPASGESILTVNTSTVFNTATGQFGRILSPALSLNAGGSSMLLRYPSGNGLDTNTLMANAGLTWRLNVRNSFSSSYAFSQFAYPGSSVSFGTESALFSYKRQWNRRLSTSVGAGPEWIDSSNSALVPPSTRVSVNAAINDQLRFGSAGLSFTQGTSGGAGYLVGSEIDSVNANFSREFTKNLTIGITGSYMRTEGLANNGVTNAKYGGAQATRRLGRYLTAFANYTAIDQTSSSTLSSNVLKGLQQLIGFGIGYSPRQTKLRQ